jgi:hypothetical protein
MFPIRSFTPQQTKVFALTAGFSLNWGSHNEEEMVDLFFLTAKNKKKL